MIKDINKLEITGKLTKQFEFSHSSYEDYYESELKVRRLSGEYDILKVIIGKNLLSSMKLAEDTHVHINGQFRSRNFKQNGKHKLDLYIFVQDIDIIEPLEVDINNVILEGYICKEPIYRKTPRNREICDIFVAINRLENKFTEKYTCDYLPCICWGKTARFSKEYDVGTKIHAEARVQSREYVKRSEDTSEVRRAYEISIFKLELCND